MVKPCTKLGFARSLLILVDFICASPSSLQSGFWMEELYTSRIDYLECVGIDGVEVGLIFGSEAANVAAPLYLSPDSTTKRVDRCPQPRGS